MAAFAPITLVNNAAANVVFSPLNINTASGVAIYATADAVYDAKSIMTVSAKAPSGNSTRAKFRAKITIPVMDPVLTSTKIDESIVTVEFSLPRDVALTPRLDANAYLKDLLTETVVTAFLTSFEGVY